MRKRANVAAVSDFGGVFVRGRPCINCLANVEAEAGRHRSGVDNAESSSLQVNAVRSQQDWRGRKVVVL